MEKRLYGDNVVDKSKLGLTRAAKVESLHGIIFATFNPEAEPLREHLGEALPFLDATFGRRAGGIKIVGHPVKWRIPANWKSYQDNFAGDEYHVGYVHGAGARAIQFDVPAFLNRLIHCYTPRGHGWSAEYELPNGSADPRVPLNPPEELYSSATRDYMYGALPEAVDRCSAPHLRAQIIAGIVFPNFSMLPTFNNFRILHPKGPNEFELWMYAYVDRDAPDDVARELATMAMFSFSPSGIIEQDDAAIWESINRSASGVLGVAHDSWYHMGLGTERWHDDLQCMITDKLSEAAMRNFYREWSRRMGDPR
jgi:phenylpropionate dioxygenase-like ring-hydroxylating dioxygenase large terminal subunit